MYSIIAFGKTIFRDLKPYNKITLWPFFFFFFFKYMDILHKNMA